MIRIIIAGGRDFTDYDYFNNWMDSFLPKEKHHMEIVSGGAKGVDAMAERFAQEQNVPVKIFPADWKSYGRAAGPKRNQQMAEYATMLIAFWDEKSAGTKSMIKLAFRSKVKMIFVHNYLKGITYIATYDADREFYDCAAELQQLTS